MSDVRVTVVPVDVLDEIRDELAALKEKIETPSSPKRWYTLREAAELKGMSYEVVRKLPPKYWPNFGHSQTLVSGSRRYNRVYRDVDVYRWLDMTEEDIEREYRAMLRETAV